MWLGRRVLQRVPWHHLTFWNVILAVSIGLPLWNEFLAYWWARLLFPSLPWSDKDQLRILFVADPQIQGYLYEHPVYGIITRWDSDRYLSRTFGLACAYTSPHVIVYLGDLFDEGSFAKEQDYEIYYQRFLSLFSTDKDTKHIYIPGDNDIGGEGGDRVTTEKVGRFQKHFGNIQGVLNAGPVDFIKLDFGIGAMPVDEMKERMRRQRAESKAQYRILVNHEPVLQRYRENFQPIVDIFEPTFIFSAHDHTTRLYTCADCREEPTFRDSKRFMGGGHSLDNSEVLTFDLRNTKVSLNEITVATCSYRMGVPHMGYGVAILRNPGKIIYTTLWSPSRYFQLYSYLYIYVGVACAVFFRLLLYLALRFSPR